MIKTAEEFVTWLEGRIEYYNYEYRYSNSETTKITIDAKRIEAEEILEKVKNLNVQPTHSADNHAV